MSHLIVQIIDDFQGFLSLEREWPSLLAQSSSNSVFLTHQWFRCWWEAFGKKHQMFVICVRNNGKLVGVAPLHLQETHFRGLPVKKLSFMANAYTAEADLLLTTPEQDVLGSILDCLEAHRRQWDWLELPRLRDDSLVLGYVSDLGQKSHWLHQVRPDLEIPYITVEGDWESFMSKRSRNFRNGITNRINRISKLPRPVRVAKVNSTDEIVDNMPDMLKISTKSWKAQVNSSIADEPGALEFLKRLSAVMGKKGWVNLWILYYDHIAIAFEYHLNYDGVTSPIRKDFDEDYRYFSPGAHLEYVIMRTLFEEEAQPVIEYNTCGDSYAYVLRWTDQIRRHKKLWIFQKSWYGKVLHAAGLLRRFWRRRVMRSMRSCRR